MIKSAYKIRCLIGLIVSECESPLQQNKGLTTGVAGSAYPLHKQEVERGTLTMVECLEPQSHPPVTLLLQKSHTS